MRIVTILSDFGQGDSYVAQMKGAILSICPQANIVDISHAVERHNIAQGAFLLETAVHFFPKKSTHLAVVDPGVGTERLPLVVVAGDRFLVGPNNGLLAKAANRLGISEVYGIDLGKPGFGQVSNTFHGRDIFAKAAGMLACGVRPGKLGFRVKSLRPLMFAKAAFKDKILGCTILHIDAFGNIITSASNRQFSRLGRKGSAVGVRSLKSARTARVARTYSDVARGDLVVLEGSQGYIEVASREGDAGALLQARVGERLKISAG